LLVYVPEASFKAPNPPPMQLHGTIYKMKSLPLLLNAAPERTR